MAEKIDELLMLARLGDEVALSAIFEMYKGNVIGIAKHFDVAGEDLEDLVQEGSLGLYKAILSYDSAKNDNFLAYSNILIKRQILNALKSSQSKKNFELNNSVPIIDEYTLADESITSPDDLLLGSEEARQIESKIRGALSSLEYSVYRLFVDGYNYIDIANILGKSAKSVDNALSRAKSKVKELLQEEGK